MLFSMCSMLFTSFICFHSFSRCVILSCLSLFACVFHVLFFHCVTMCHLCVCCFCLHTCCLTCVIVALFLHFFNSCVSTLFLQKKQTFKKCSLWSSFITILVLVLVLVPGTSTSTSTSTSTRTSISTSASTTVID
jgi:hypothetical protein